MSEPTPDAPENQHVPGPHQKADAEPMPVEPDAAATEVTGDATIDAALQTLRHLDEVPVRDHAEVVERVHRVLQDRLADGQE